MKGKKKFVKNLIKWQGNNCRKFAWRNTNDPYRILISEILLQRTRAEKVQEIFNQFFDKYPDLISLSDASQKDVSKIIEPLGLKKRATYLIELSEFIRDNHNSEVPDSKDELLIIKGIGFYTANAVMCFAFGKRRAIVDWNVARVIKRIWNMDISSSPHTNEKVMSFAQNLLPEKNPKEYNWALLDFAALVCKPRKPDCLNCPMQNFCEYHRKDPLFK